MWKKTVIIRASMTNSFVHARDQLAVNRSAVTANNACYATHFESWKLARESIRFTGPGTYLIRLLTVSLIELNTLRRRSGVMKGDVQA